MAGTVRYDTQDDTWFFNGVQRRHDGAASLVVKHRDLEKATATDLAREMRKARRRELDPESVLIDTAPMSTTRRKTLSSRIFRSVLAKRINSLWSSVSRVAIRRSMTVNSEQ